MMEQNPLLSERIRGKTDRELLEMFFVNPKTYSTETLELVKKEIAARGGPGTLKERVQASGEKAPEINDLAERILNARKATPPEPKTSGLSSIRIRSRVLKEESVLNEWSMMVDHGSGNADFVIDGIQRRLEESRIPGNCNWAVEDVKSSGFLARVRREFLIVSLDEFADYHMYVGVRDYGIHLDCCRFLTVEPGFLKKWASEKLTGYADALSAPKNILIHQDLRAWTTVVHHAVVSSVEDLMVKLGQDTKLLQRGSKGFLEIW